MKVVLQENVGGRGQKGQLVEVADGYARNFLIPRGLAVEATAAALNELRNREASKAYRLAEERKAAEADREKIHERTVRLSFRAGEGGKLFGSVTAKEIAEGIEQQLGAVIDRRKIELPEEIRTFGSYTIEVRLHAGVTASVYLIVGEG